MPAGEIGEAPPPDRDLAAHRALADSSRVRILEELQRAESPLDAAELAGRVGLHHNTVRSHLQVLSKAGLITAEPEWRDGPGRRRVVYRPAPEAPPEESGGFRLLAYILASHLAGSSPDPAAAAVEAGRAWGRYLADRPAPFAKTSPREAMERITGLFERLGFQPEQGDDPERPRMLLHRCPFLDLAKTHPEIACSVHLGLIRGALAEVDAPLEATDLEPFVTPSLCVASFGAPRGERKEEDAAGTGRGDGKGGPP
ncbi:MAG: helix-turn-helix domain-containing protein [Candidatus Dormibacteraeota bacterium]|nr:helix-turn-helix domain-containing protein [Candidatus Dormibacteraeota bacterium]MBO0760244.1 helix-turn-helix domain-containing protein [Candidatus Dormibacteraeota bacterium]